jgi:putative transcriptional regulator
VRRVAKARRRTGDAETGPSPASARPTARMRPQPSIGAQIIEGLREAIAYERGKVVGLRVSRAPMTVREVAVSSAPAYDANRVRRVRGALAVSQRVFAELLNVSLATVRAWEQGQRVPDGPTQRLLEIAERNPAVLLELVGVR